LVQALQSDGAETPAEVPVERDQASAPRVDGNNVNVESEMVNLAQNTELFTMVSKVVSKNLSMARYVISGGTRS
jgi:flagellar basal-body rod protein FlgB